MVERYCCLVKTFLRDYMGWAVSSFDQNFPKKLYRLTAFSFHQNLLKRLYELNHIVFFSKFTIRTAWVDPYTLLIKYFQKDYIDWNPLFFHYNFRKRQGGVNRIAIWSEFSKKTNPLYVTIFLKVKMGWTIFSFGQNFLKSLCGLNLIVLL